MELIIDKLAKRVPGWQGKLYSNSKNWNLFVRSSLQSVFFSIRLTGGPHHVVFYLHPESLLAHDILPAKSPTRFAHPVIPRRFPLMFPHRSTGARPLPSPLIELEAAQPSSLLWTSPASVLCLGHLLDAPNLPN